MIEIEIIEVYSKVYFILLIEVDETYTYKKWQLYKCTHGNKVTIIEFFYVKMLLLFQSILKIKI